MRVSDYIVTAKLGDSTSAVILHGFSGAVDNVPADLARLLEESRGKDLDEITPAFPTETVKALAARGYLTELSASEEQQILKAIALEIHASDLANSPVSTIFVPAYTCNLRCPYCFQSHDLHQGKGRFGQILSEELVDSAFLIRERLCEGELLPVPAAVAELHRPQKRPQSTHIGLFGGEPLSQMTVPIVRYILDQAVERGLTVDAITNGVELQLFRDLLGPTKLGELQITLDGSSAIHDRRRVGPGFKATFDLISANIDMALEAGTRVNLRMNIDSLNAATFESLSDLCDQRGWSASGLFSAHAAAVTAERNYRKVIDHTAVTEMTMDLQKRKSSVFKSYENTARELLESCLFREGYPFQSVSFCGAETGMLLFDPLGDVYACWEDIGTPTNRVGTYGKGGAINFELGRMTSWLSRFPGAIEECVKCPYALIHRSGCGKHAEQVEGTMFASSCESFQTYFQDALAHVFRELVSEPPESTH